MESSSQKKVSEEDVRKLLRVVHIRLALVQHQRCGKTGKLFVAADTYIYLDGEIKRCLGIYPLDPKVCYEVAKQVTEALHCAQCPTCTLT